MRVQIRQGDVLLVPVEDHEVPPTAREIQPTERGYVLAEGEATGHAHCITQTEFTRMFEGTDSETYVNVSSPVPLVHEEHGSAELTTGITYRVVRQEEYTPERSRYVMD